MLQEEKDWVIVGRRVVEDKANQKWGTRIRASFRGPFRVLATPVRSFKELVVGYSHNGRAQRVWRSKTVAQVSFSFDFGGRRAQNASGGLVKSTVLQNASGGLVKSTVPQILSQGSVGVTDDREGCANVEAGIRGA